MSSLTYKASFSYDQETIAPVIVVQCNLMNAEESASLLQPDPIEALKSLHQSGHGLSQKAADTYLKKVDKNRKEGRTNFSPQKSP